MAVPTLSVALVVTATSVLIANFRYGGGPERFGVGILLGADVVDLFYHALFGMARYATIDLGHMAINAACMVGFITLALQANRVWPIWCCALQLIMALGHLGELAYPQGAPMAYWLMTGPPTMGQTLAVTLGTVAHWRRTARIGRYRNWRLA
ncbi:MAG: hypothetical protein KGL44_07845 [Sphingomonadales bacterium]|nr:hypothetical protein [Sphingomonadales bacterium]